MNARELIEEINSLSLSIPIVKSFYDTDPYSSWNSNEVEYGSVVFTLSGATIMDNTIRYRAIIYYGDRLVEDESNVNNCFVDAERVITKIIDELEESDMIVQVVTASPQITFFRQRFLDNLAGAYCDLTIEVNKESLCDWSDSE